MNSNPDIEDVVQVAHEVLRVDKQTVETGRLRVQTQVEAQPAWVRETLAREDVEVAWVEVDQPVEAPPAPRTEGDTLIIPLVEEVLVVEKRLVVRRELHITRRVTDEVFEQPVTLRRTDATVTRLDANPEPTPPTLKDLP